MNRKSRDEEEREARELRYARNRAAYAARPSKVDYSEFFNGMKGGQPEAEPRPLTREELAGIRGYAKDTSESGASTAAQLLLAHDFWRDEAKTAQRDYCRLKASTPGRAGSAGSARDVARDLGWDDLDWETHGE